MRSAIDALARLASRCVAGSVELLRMVRGRGDSGMDPVGRPCPLSGIAHRSQFMYDGRHAKAKTQRQSGGQRCHARTHRGCGRPSNPSQRVRRYWRRGHHEGGRADARRLLLPFLVTRRHAGRGSAKGMRGVRCRRGRGRGQRTLRPGLGIHAWRLSLEGTPRACRRGMPARCIGFGDVSPGSEVRRVATRHIKEMIDLIARRSPDWGQPAVHERAMVTIATMVGALMLSRAVDEPGLSDSLREAALKSLTPAGH